jgi:Ca2+-binding EF-hand superfamily protein
MFFFSQNRSRFSNLSHLSDDEKKTILNQFGKWWTECLLFGKSELTESDFIEVMSNKWESNSNVFVKMMYTCNDMIGNMVDTNNDGSITKEEFSVILKSGGHKNDPLDEKFFEDFHPIDGKVPIRVMTDSWVTFLTCEDSTKPDLVKSAIEFGV